MRSARQPWRCISAIYIIVAGSFSVLSLLPAVLLHISLRSRPRFLWITGYAVSAAAVALHIRDLHHRGREFFRSESAAGRAAAYLPSIPPALSLDHWICGQRGSRGAAYRRSTSSWQGVFPF